MKFSFPDGKEPYPEIHEFEWAKEFDAVMEASKALREKGKHVGPIPLTLVLKIVEETLSYPEIVEAIKIISISHPLEGDVNRAKFITMWFHEYLAYKYQNDSYDSIVSPVSESIIPTRKIILGAYSGLADPKMIESLLKNPDMQDDRED